MARGQGNRGNQDGTGHKFQKGKPKTGGKVKGSKNLSTIEKNEIRKMEAITPRGPSDSLAKDNLHRYIAKMEGWAARYEKALFKLMKATDDVPPETATPMMEKFITFLSLAADNASKLANYQSPKYRAVHIVAPSDPMSRDPGLDEDGRKIITLRVFDGKKVATIKQIEVDRDRKVS